MVGIVMGSESDLPVVEGAFEILRSFDIPFEVRVLSAHRTPDETAEWASTARKRGLKVLLAAAGGAAHLGGVVAAHTTLPVIGIPVGGGSLNGLDALLATVQMPSGVPVATVAIGGSKNAALLAVQILGTADPAIEARLDEYKSEMRRNVAAMDERVRGKAAQ
ncbi:MAG TPA: 5-(carboxyamino)imidazole ribonucleotide mutase [Rhodothermales bacterium]|nr:5-(carboxyamino)imidazole ribonucleotide mutase [Rhodothermales bacterium]